LIISTKRDKFVPIAVSRIFSKHFKDEDFRQIKNSMNPDAKLRLLKKDAVPSIFNFPLHLKINEPKYWRLSQKRIRKQSHMIE
jgi:hypothetical protein